MTVNADGWTPPRQSWVKEHLQEAVERHDAEREAALLEIAEAQVRWHAEREAKHRSKREEWKQEMRRLRGRARRTKEETDRPG